MIIEATATQVSDAINLATYKAGLLGINRKIVAQSNLGNGKHSVVFGGGDTLNVTLINGAYPYITSINGAPGVLDATAQAPLPIKERPAAPYKAAPPPPPAPPAAKT